MLAFTVQFSSYGRKPGSLGASALGRPRPFESAPFESGCFLRTQQCARNSFRFPPSFRSSPEGKSVLTGLPWQGNRIASAPLESMDARSHSR